MNEEKIKLRARRERYVRDPLPVRLANLASNLARLKSFGQHPSMGDAAHRIVYESKYFIEWTIGEALLAVQVELIELQRVLARWQLEWNDVWSDSDRRKLVTEQADLWSKRILESSGLLKP